MKKEEILEKARAEKSDEMENAVRDRSALWMAVAMVAAAVFFVCMRGKDEPIMDLAAIVGFSGMVCCGYRFFKLKKPVYLISGLILAGITVFSTIRFFMGH